MFASELFNIALALCSLIIIIIIIIIIMKKITNNARRHFCKDLTRSREICVAIGSNLGNTFENFHSALLLLNEHGFETKRLGSLYETKPDGSAARSIDERKFLNSAMILSHAEARSAQECLKELKEIERKLGRDVNDKSKGPRVIDLDILFSEKEPIVDVRGSSFRYGSSEHDREGGVYKWEVQVPHPRVKERAFALAPVADLCEKTSFSKTDVSISMENQMIAAKKAWEVMRVNVDEDVIRRVAPFKRDSELEPYEKYSKIMGVLNITPDSFSDGGLYNANVETAVRRAEQLANEGARIIDVGGQSTRPGASRVSASDEISRVAPVLRAICKRFKNDPRNIAVSIDTFYGEVVKMADQIGIDIINDVSGGDWDDQMLSAVANTKSPLAYILSHQRGNPEIMSANALYDIGKVAKTVGDEISAQYFDKLLPLGITSWRCWIDPGFGFAKTSEQCVELLSDLKNIRKSLAINESAGLAHVPMLVGMSRKRFIGNMMQNNNNSNNNNGNSDNNAEIIAKDERDVASAAAAVIALTNGANFVRAHDVILHFKMCKVADSLL